MRSPSCRSIAPSALRLQPLRQLLDTDGSRFRREKKTDSRQRFRLCERRLVFAGIAQGKQSTAS